ncbi:hypothetical protein SISNIDRAFT_450428 [Sistotremastrum niveocremeum HHB9708]|uniref:Extracellular membrane protein CFEM domain-containing protein n=1 Tax=Sistotremastrum niveocremeum HHB9708 TaxID=1314777 RepID=A0A164Y968_9AGAM|nr:hypothetical protein SISNIDRAFT_450428 [Sistotremastrum niveocremeum HHB9708]
MQLLFVLILSAVSTAFAKPAANAGLAIRQSSCDDLCGSDNIEDCTTNECFCAHPYLDTFHDCLQCQLNEDKGNVPDDELDAVQDSFQADLDVVIKGCRNLGISVPDEPLTSPGAGGSTPQTSTSAPSSSTSSPASTTSSSPTSSASSTPVSSAPSSSSPSATSKSGAVSVQHRAYFVVSIAALGVLFTQAL